MVIKSISKSVEFIWNVLYTFLKIVENPWTPREGKASREFFTQNSPNSEIHNEPSFGGWTGALNMFVNKGNQKLNPVLKS